MSDWGKGVNNNIGWGQGGTNDIGYGSIYADSNSGLTLLLKDNTAFIIEVKTDNAGTSNDNQFQFTGAEGDYDVVAKQNDIVVATFNDLSDEETITFANGAGTYILEVKAKEVDGFTGMRFNNSGDNEKITKNLQWGIFNDTRQQLFFGCSNLTEIGSDVNWLNNITNGDGMFRNCNLTSLPSEMTLANLTNGDEMFENNTIITSRYSTLLVDMENFNSNTNVSFHGGNSKYNAAGETARNLLIANKNWSFTDGGLA